VKTSVYSEIGRLRKVLVHRPGKEIETVVPEAANDLLFEDILFTAKAQEEHDSLCHVLQKYGVETLDTQDLLIEALEASRPQEREELVSCIFSLENFQRSTLEKLNKMSPAALGSTLVEGIVQTHQKMLEGSYYELPPVPNLIFARDPVIIGFDRVLASSMAEKARFREAEMMKFIFNHHPIYKTEKPLVDLQKVSTDDVKLTIEGGDFLVLNEETVAIAWSKRTSYESIRLLAKELQKINVKNLVVAKLPHLTSFIHLDTVFTRINHDECLIYPPLFAPEATQKAKIYHFDLRDSEPKEKEYPSIFDLLKSLGMNLKPIYCGGRESLISQKREQWTQGANAFCIAPGVILTYQRNVETCKDLNRAGYMCINADEVLRPSFTPSLTQKTAILIEGHELCRARGGIRCLTHPLLREPV
jgi:arginine deiminase